MNECMNESMTKKERSSVLPVGEHTMLKCKRFVFPFLQVHKAHLNEISVTDHESMPGFRISSTAKVAIDKKYLCPLCQLIFKDPAQTDCGHVYCNSCLQELKRYL